MGAEVLAEIATTIDAEIESRKWYRDLPSATADDLAYFSGGVNALRILRGKLLGVSTETVK